MRIPSKLLWAVVSLSTVCVCGCYSPYIRGPNFTNPGTAQQQRAEAERFDPYPDPNMGPEVVGGRPLGFTRPFNDTEWGRRFVPPPGGVVPVVPVTPPVYTNPFPSAALPAPPVQSAPAVSSQLQRRSPY